MKTKERILEETDAYLYHQLGVDVGKLNFVLNAMEIYADQFFSKEELRYAYYAGSANIDSDGCNIDPPIQDFEDAVKEILQERTNPITPKKE